LLGAAFLAALGLAAYLAPIDGCTVCQGTGVLPSQNPDYDCPFCEGKGRLS